MRTSIVSWVLVWAALGCGASSAESSLASEEVPPAATAGDENTPDEPAPAEAEPALAEPEPIEAAPAPSGPGKVTVSALVGSQAVPAKVRILDASGAVQAEGTAGETLSVLAGQYQVEVKITDPAVFADMPSQLRDLRLEAGQDLKLETRFRWAKVQLNVMAGGRSQPGSRVKLLRDGEVVAEMKSGAPPQPISPGRYEADVLLRGAIIRVKGLQFPEGATQTVPVNVQY